MALSSIKDIQEERGRRHDYDIYKENHPVTSKQIVNVVDLGYWYRKGFPTATISALPYKKKRNRKSSQVQKDYNKKHAKRRIVIENIPSAD